MPTDVSGEVEGLKAGASNPLGISIFFDPYKTKVDEASSTTTYIGKAVSGSLTSAAVWLIVKISVSGTVTSIDKADGNLKFDNVWDDRASLTYS